MKFLPLVLANLGRHKRRTFLTIASVALALFLFASLRTVVTTLERAAQFGSARRLVMTNATGFVLPLPLSYANRLSAANGISNVTWANWFGGKYGDGKRFFAQFAVDPKSYLEVYPEIQMPEDQKQAFLRERSSAIVGRRLLDVFGWKLGQNVTIQGTIFPGDWTFTIRGVYTPSDPIINDDMMLFHHAYLEERVGRPGIAGWYVLEIDDANHAASHRQGARRPVPNSSAPTKTGTEQAFNASFATMWGNVSLLMGTIGMAVVFAILLVTANAMMMSARERTGEVAVLKTIGFTDGEPLRHGDAGGRRHRADRRGPRTRRGEAAVQGVQLQRGRVSSGLRRHREHAGRGLGHRAGADAGERAGAGDPGRAAAGGAGAPEGRMKIPLSYNARSVLQRPVSTAFTALGIGLVVAVFIGMLALANGFRVRAGPHRLGAERAGAPAGRGLGDVEQPRPAERSAFSRPRPTSPLEQTGGRW